MNANDRSVCRIAFGVCLFLGPILGGLVACSLTTAGDWTRFRGENGTGISADADVPLKWSDTENVKWRTELPGAGFSSPIVVGDRVVVTCYSGYGVDPRNPGEMEDLKRHVVCVNRTSGKILWTATVPAVLPEDPYAPPGVTAHGYASHTPATDGERIFVFLGKSGVLAYDLGGDQLWQTQVGTESDPSNWGSAASPIVYKDLVIVNASAESQALIALDAKTGKEVWRAEAEGIASTWSTPILVESSTGPELILPVPAEIWAFRPQTGKLKWYATGSGARGMASSLVAGEGVVYCIGGMQGGGSVAVRIGGSGDVSNSNIVWKQKGYSAFGSPVLHNGFLYGADEGGVAFCVSAATGELVYQARLASGESPAPAPEADGGRRRGGGRGPRSYGSALLIGDKVFVTEASGETFIFAASPEKFTLIGTNKIGRNEGGFNATPAVSNGELFLRSNNALYCVSSK